MPPIGFRGPGGVGGNRGPGGIGGGRGPGAGGLDASTLYDRWTSKGDRSNVNRRYFAC